MSKMLSNRFFMVIPRFLLTPSRPPWEARGAEGICIGIYPDAREYSLAMRIDFYFCAGSVIPARENSKRIASALNSSCITRSEIVRISNPSTNRIA